MKWILEQESIDWDELSNLYTMAPLGDKKPNDLKVAFSNSMYKCFVFGIPIGDESLPDPGVMETRRW